MVYFLEEEQESLENQWAQFIKILLHRDKNSSTEIPNLSLENMPE